MKRLAACVFAVVVAGTLAVGIALVGCATRPPVARQPSQPPATPTVQAAQPAPSAQPLPGAPELVTPQPSQAPSTPAVTLREGRMNEVTPGTSTPEPPRQPSATPTPSVTQNQPSAPSAGASNDLSGIVNTLVGLGGDDPYAQGAMQGAGALGLRGGGRGGAGGAGGGAGPRGGGGGVAGRGAGRGAGGAIAGGRGGVPGALNRINVPMTDEELWVISKPTGQLAMAPGLKDQIPGAGALVVKVPERNEQVPVPLKHTNVNASITGYIATVDVTQQYHNPFDKKIEAVYLFPLPQNAAINEFLMTIGDRKIRGIIRERKEAERIYQEARTQGYVASLLTQERPNIFTQSVANIEPGKDIDIDIKYFNTLQYVDGWYEWTFPMVVGPRFNPPYTTDGIGAVATDAKGLSGQKTEIQYLQPGQRNGHDISLTAQIDAGVKIEQIESLNHQILKKTDDPGSATVVLDPLDSIPNKDFVLRYKVAGETLKSAIMVQRDPSGDGGYFTLMLVPPASMSNLPRQPLEMVFTLDISGSMNGAPIEQSRKAIRYALTHMNPQDTFQIVRFFSQAESMTPMPVPATEANIQQGLQYIQTMSAGGGTMMIEGIKKSLDFPRDESRLRFVAFLTDGYIGNEAQILGAVHDSLRDSRIFSFGVGSSPNRYLLDHMAKMGAGASAYLSLNDNPDEIIAAYFERISHPALTDISVDFGGMQVSNIFPSRIPDLFVGRPVIITGRFKGASQDTVRVRGRVGGQAREFVIPVRMDDSSNQHRGVAAVWARMKISDLADQSTWSTTSNFANDIKQVALDYGLMSQFTALVAVDSTRKTEGEAGSTVAVPVPVPEGVDYNTTVQQRPGAAAPAGREQRP